MPDYVPTLEDLSLEQKVGQVVMGGFPDPVADAATLAAVRDGSLGNIILFARNCPDAQSVARLTRALQDAAPIPLLIAADQEGMDRLLAEDPEARAAFAAALELNPEFRRRMDEEAARQHGE